MRDKRVFSDTQADLSALSVYLGPFYVPTPTYAFIPLFRVWMSERGIASEIVRYQSRIFEHWPPTLPITVLKSRSRRRMLSASATPLVDASHTNDERKSLDTGQLANVSACRRRCRRRSLARRTRWTRCLRPVGSGRVHRGVGLRRLCRDPERRPGGPAPHHDRCDRRRWKVEDHPSCSDPAVRHWAGHS